jgi:hypothetical protein
MKKILILFITALLIITPVLAATYSPGKSVQFSFRNITNIEISYSQQMPGCEYTKIHTGPYNTSFAYIANDTASIIVIPNQSVDANFTTCYTRNCFLGIVCL